MALAGVVESAADRLKHHGNLSGHLNGSGRSVRQTLYNGHAHRRGHDRRMTVETVAGEYLLTLEQVRAALAYAAHVAAHLPPAVRQAS